MSKMKQISAIVGFDLGDGESSVSECQLNGSSEPDVLKLVDNRQSFITCIGRDRSGRILIGQAALESANTNAAHLTFKRRKESRQLARDFFQEVLRRAELAGSSIGNAYVVVGHPSAWTTQEVQEYIDELQGATGWRVQGISESRAAFLQLKESSKLTVEQLRSTTLIVDVGSSTTDFTLIKNLKQQPIEFGHNDLGGRLIDRAILNFVVKKYPDPEKLNRLFGQFSHIYAQCEHLCRVVKESYFTEEAKYLETNELIACKQFVEIDESTIFRLKLTASDMQQILKAPQVDLGNLCWEETFRRTLQQVKLQGPSADPAKTIALTGGGARMSFVRKICQEVFPDASLLIDSSPEFTIVKGLARAGKLDMFSASFFDELDPLCSDLPKAFKDEVGVFLEGAVKPLAVDFVNSVIRSGLVNWREGRVHSLNNLEKHLEELGVNWAKTAAVSDIVGKATQAWTQRSLLHITPKILDLTHRYSLPYESLKLTLDSVRPQNVNAPIGNIRNETVAAPGFAAGGIAAFIALNIAATITPIILAILVKSTIITAAITGPIGWLVGGVIVVAGFLFGKEKAEEAIKDANLPNWIRTMLLSDSKINDACRSSITEVAAAINAEMCLAAESELISKATQVVREELAKKMKEAVVLIGR